MRTDRWRYARWTDADDRITGEILFDLQADPAERHNLAASAEHADVLAELRGKITDYQQRPSK